MKGLGKFATGIIVLALIAATIVYFAAPYFLGPIVEPVTVKRSEIVQTIVASFRLKALRLAEVMR
jgi:multidrug efflux pump subunit AcrA (membrane-fusion protein)